ncbi:helix-turn-helix transcriptional regulator [Miniphocaeibacter massiliensis]|uniref:helix-turn-helix transcriptional regulator n=1 Tax=Miniphocaeibacter massiliensis TaxID=2041841 RepID=UPI000C082227|nr:helix-turn-helix transcriptional regulator [Miniphocaeibacter massiliensis]
MNLENQIKSHRKRLSLSQDELGDKLYVTRQTISNWETGKSYPDVNNLILLSSLFEISIDELIKGDIEEIRKIVDESVVTRLQKLSVIYTVCFIVMLLSIAPLFYYFKWIGFCIWLVIAVICFIPAIKIEKIKKQEDIQSYKEIVAFMDGERLDEIQKATEKGKRIYQKIFQGVIFSVIGFAVGYLMMMLLDKFA